MNMNFLEMIRMTVEQSAVMTWSGVDFDRERLQIVLPGDTVLTFLKNDAKDVIMIQESPDMKDVHMNVGTWQEAYRLVSSWADHEKGGGR